MYVYFVLWIAALLFGCLPMAMPPLDVEAAAGIASARNSNSNKVDRADQLRHIQSLRVGTNLLQGFERLKNRRFDLGGGFIASESISDLYDEQGWYVRVSYYPRIGIESFQDIRNPTRALLYPFAAHAFPRIRLGIHATGSVLDVDSFSDPGISVALTGEMVLDNGQRHTIACGVANFGYSGDTSVGLKVTGGVREFAGERYWLATVGMTVKLPAIGGVVGVPTIFCRDDDDDDDDEASDAT
ncbi:MAG: hypothetical protein MJE77_40375 [Proteobacteria bacterium]|nr:hypothetical protein [Pseudomonadota bacterium]